MNAKAKELGMNATTFRNASGLPDKKQITTARDMAKLAEASTWTTRTGITTFRCPRSAGASAST